MCWVHTCCFSTREQCLDRRVCAERRQHRIRRRGTWRLETDWLRCPPSTSTRTACRWNSPKSSTTSRTAVLQRCPWVQFSRPNPTICWPNPIESISTRLVTNRQFKDRKWKKLIKYLISYKIKHRLIVKYSTIQFITSPTTQPQKQAISIAFWSTIKYIWKKSNNLFSKMGIRPNPMQSMDGSNQWKTLP